MYGIVLDLEPDAILWDGRVYVDALVEFLEDLRIAAGSVFLIVRRLFCATEQ